MERIEHQRRRREYDDDDVVGGDMMELNWMEGTLRLGSAPGLPVQTGFKPY